MRVVLATVPHFPDLQADLNQLETAYTELNVEVVRYDPGAAAAEDSVFLRDVFAWTPFKYVRPQLMGKESRQWEVQSFFDAVIPHREDYWTLREGTFEGADFLLTTRRHAIIGVGKRTNDAGVECLIDLLEHYDEYFTNTTLYLPDWHDQHLLGLLNVIEGYKICVDSRVLEECGEEPPACLEDAIVLPHEEYYLKHTNFVQIRDSIIINSACTKTREILESLNIVNVIPVDIPALVANGGGVACTTGILKPW